MCVLYTSWTTTLPLPLLSQGEAPVNISHYQNYSRLTRSAYRHIERLGPGDTQHSTTSSTGIALSYTVPVHMTTSLLSLSYSTCCTVVHEISYTLSVILVVAKTLKSDMRAFGQHCILWFMSFLQVVRTTRPLLPLPPHRTHFTHPSPPHRTHFTHPLPHRTHLNLQPPHRTHLTPPPSHRTHLTPPSPHRTNSPHKPLNQPLLSQTTDQWSVKMIM